MVKQSGKYTFYCVCGYIPEKKSLSESLYLINQHNKVCTETLDVNDYIKKSSLPKEKMLIYTK